MINNQTFGMQNHYSISTIKSRISQKEFTNIQMMLRHCMLLSKMRKWKIIIIVIHLSISCNICKTIESSLICGSGGTPIGQIWGSLKEINVEISFGPVLGSRLVIQFHCRYLRCQTLVSSDWAVCGTPCLLKYGLIELMIHSWNWSWYLTIEIVL